MSHSQFRRVMGSICCIAVVAMSAGCSSGDANLANVYGTVTLNGVPANAEILFQPLQGEGGASPGRASAGTAEGDGHFKMQYTRKKAGVIIGPHRVHLTVWEPASRGAKQEGKTKTAQFVREVKSGNNRFNFAITY